jgi:hypothetical protein
MKSVFKLPSKKQDKDKPRAIDKMLEELKRCVCSPCLLLFVAFAQAQVCKRCVKVLRYVVHHDAIACFEYALPAANSAHAV